jgi:signal transduction histidine kinase
VEICRPSFTITCGKQLKKTKKTFEGEVTNKTKDGRLYDAHVNINPVLSEDRDILFFVGIERDITREKNVNRMKTEFISLAAHQLRTPLSSIKWFVEMLLSGDAGKVSKDQKELLDNIDGSNERMIVLVNTLLNISRIESGRISIDPVLTNIKDLIENVVNELNPQIKLRKHKFSLKIEEGLPKIPLDPKMIRNVYMNLISNAIKYTPNKGEISVDVYTEGKMIISKISDTGFGIPQKEKERVFTRFFRASNVQKAETDGSGLGLYLAESVVKSSGGEIWFESTENKGTSFWFSLPLKGVKPKKGEVSLDS